ncbi:Cof-type HAD-IIB family hydrolase [Mycoplasma sp. SG1]|uniref:Cof-type HAD-IIB family hydrolase n=1 Tax=Mycoplasma sp. SG1 TaxID=2810348 RepID=UPI002024DAA4|nr:Cof-type HAD-IIB family hydrolase [Mycoplasma sp. SG1]URM53165.1 Cof-type HAD-IIB family hydrolase [Mycoplasma sp. SG1]
MKQWIILLDLDGTLLKNDGYFIHEDNIKAIKELTRLKHYVIINTGRPPRAIKKIYQQLELSTPVSCYNGSYIFFPKSEEIINNLTIDKDVVLKILNTPFIKNNSLCTLVEAQNESYLSNNCYAIFNECWLNYSTKIHVGEIEKCNPLINGIYFQTLSHIDPIKYGQVLTNFSDVISYRVWKEVSNKASVIINVYPKGITKKFSIDFFQKYYGIDKENILSIGDGNNDYDVIQHAGVGVAMKNGNPHIKKIAKFVTEFSNEEGGVGKFLIKFFKLKN